MAPASGVDRACERHREGLDPGPPRPRDPATPRPRTPRPRDPATPRPRDKIRAISRDLAPTPTHERGSFKDLDQILDGVFVRAVQESMADSRIQVPDQPVGRLSDAWRYCVGTGRFELALRRDYQDSLALIQREIGFRHIRGHGLLSDGVGIHRPYEYQGARRVRHAFTYVDQVVDAYLDLGIRPFLELGFMPSGAGLRRPDRVLVARQRHPAARPGPSGPTWSGPRWRIWSTATGSTRCAAGRSRCGTSPTSQSSGPDADQDAVPPAVRGDARTRSRRSTPRCRSAGRPSPPAPTTGWCAFADFVAARAVPIDFVSRHAYTSGPAQHVPFGTHQTLAPAADLLEQFAAPARQLRGTALAGLPVHITEFNSSYRPDNPIHDTAFHAAYLAPVRGRRRRPGRLLLVLDVQRRVRGGGRARPSLFHGGFGLLTHRQIKKPTYHLYAFMARMGDQVLARGADHLVTRDGDRPGHRAGLGAGGRHRPGRRSTGTPCGCPSRSARPAPTSAFVLRSSVSEEMGNAWAAWCEMGRPRSPRPRPARRAAGGGRAAAAATAACRSSPGGSTSTSPSPGTR